MPTIKAIAYNFITDRCTNEVIAVGINSVREILVRVPALLLEEDMEDFIQDIVQYGRKSHKSVMIAAGGIINLVRYFCLRIDVLFLIKIHLDLVLNNGS